MYEVELKAKISHCINETKSRLNDLSGVPGIEQVYQDLYLDTNNRTLARAQKELRIRSVTTVVPHKNIVTILTYKEAPFDTATDSKPEFEVAVNDGAVLEYILTALGWTEDIRFVKRCVNYKVLFDTYEIAATVVTLDELPDSYIEVEIQVEHLEETENAKEALYRFLSELQIPSTALTTDGYMDMVRRARA